MTQYAVIDTTVRGLGYELVEVERAPGGLLRVTIDHPVSGGAERFINVDDCEKVWPTSGSRCRRPASTGR
jgi:ribosome maturation factor RimP